MRVRRRNEEEKEEVMTGDECKALCHTNADYATQCKSKLLLKNINTWEERSKHTTHYTNT